MASDTNKNQGVLDNTNNDQIIFGAHLNQKDMALLTNRQGSSLSSGQVVVLAGAVADIDESVEHVYDEAKPQFAFVVPDDLGNESGGDNATSSKTIADDEAGWLYKMGAICEAQVDGAVDRYEYLKLSSTAGKLTGVNVNCYQGGVPPNGTCAVALEIATGADTITVILLQPVVRELGRIRAQFIHGTQSANNKGSFHTIPLLDASDDAYASLGIPDDFASVSSAVIKIIGIDTATLTYSVTTDFADFGSNETFNTHEGSISAETLAVTANKGYELNIAAALANLAAGDTLGVQLTNDNGTCDIRAVEVYIEYNRT